MNPIGSIKRDTGCGSSYTSNNGLHFTTTCNQRIASTPQCDYETIHVTSLGECMEFCSFEHPICYGATYSGNICILKHCPITSDLLSTNASFTSVIANTTQLTPLSTACPYSDLSVITSSSGLQCTVLCNQNYGGDYITWNGPYGPHAASLEECVDRCAAAHPFCTGVSWNPNLDDGYANCYLKATGSTHAASNNTHSCRAVSDVFSRIDTTTNDSYTATNGNTFNITRFDGRSGATNLTSVHANSIGPCIDVCAGTTSCLGVVLDLSMADGFDNCYLLNSTGNAHLGVNATYAILANTNNVKQTASTPAQSNSASSNVWIAGPIVGGLVTLVGLLGFWFWKTRSRRRQRSSAIKLSDNPSHNAYHGAVLLHEKDGSPHVAMLYANERHEMMASSRPYELPSER